MASKPVSTTLLEAPALETPLKMAGAAQEYAFDAMQRWTLFLDVLRGARQQLSRDEGAHGTPCSLLRGRGDPGRPQPAAPGKLCPGAGPAAGRRRDGFAQASLHRVRSPRRPRPRHRRDEA